MKKITITLKEQRERHVPQRKKCPKCGYIKANGDFHVDKKTKDGLHSLCKECRRKARLRNRTFPPRSKEKFQPKIPMMTNEAFKLYYDNESLVQEINEYAIRRARKDLDFQEDLKQIGWMHVAMCESGLALSIYAEVAKRAMYAEYQRHYLKREYSLSDEEMMTRAEYESWKRGVEVL